MPSVYERGVCTHPYSTGKGREGAPAPTGRKEVNPHRTLPHCTHTSATLAGETFPS